MKKNNTKKKGNTMDIKDLAKKERDYKNDPRILFGLDFSLSDDPIFPDDTKDIGIDYVTINIRLYFLNLINIRVSLT